MSKPVAKPAKAKKPAKARKVAAKPAVMKVTEIRFTEVGNEPTVDFNSQQECYGDSEFFTANLNKKGNVKIVAPCGDDFEFSVATVRELILLLDIF